jgi:protein-disulfide isomerase
MTDLATQRKTNNFGKIARIAALVLIGLVGGWLARNQGLPWAHQDASIAASMPQDEFEQRVHAYLLDHPEVISDAINRLDARRAEQEAADGRAALNSHSDEIFRDKDSPVGGNLDGDVTLVEFFDYNCPYCRQMAPLMTQAEGDDPKLRIVYKEFPILGPNSMVAAKAALAAHKQGKYVAFHRALYQARGPVAESKVLEVAGEVGLDVDRLKADMQDPAFESILDKNIKLAQALGITGTPGFVFGDRILVGATDLMTLQMALQAVRDGRQETK